MIGIRWVLPKKISGALQLVISTLHNFSPLLFPIIRKPEKSARHFLHEVQHWTVLSGYQRALRHSFELRNCRVSTRAILTLPSIGLLPSYIKRLVAICSNGPESECPEQKLGTNIIQTLCISQHESAVTGSLSEGEFYHGQKSIQRTFN
jgi:hypothetical protein